MTMITLSLAQNRPFRWEMLARGAAVLLFTGLMHFAT